ncbi:hypothetical protein BMS3Abin16_01744 [archaeon BMS3Abin16]|nr:hypothetical protein BMS3Abin16_01744 [archaeon BMS3Abin16]HDY74402.1 hypothetical protein [Euryarchaeota archaeon]
MECEFVFNDEIYTAFNDLIKLAEKEIVMITPWYRPTLHMKSNLEDALNEDICFHLFTRPTEEVFPNDSDLSKHSKRVHKENLKELEDRSENLKEKGKVKVKYGGVLGIGSKVTERDRVKITYIPKLHSKLLFVDSQIALVTSANVVESSLTNTIETGAIIYESPGLLDKLIGGPLADEDDLKNPNFFESLSLFLEKLQKKSTQKIVKKSSKECEQCGKDITTQMPHDYLCKQCYRKKISKKILRKK